MDYKDIMQHVVLIVNKTQDVVQTPGGERPSNICSSCGEDILGRGEAFMLEWDMGGGMCSACVRHYRNSVDYYKEAQIEKRMRRDAQYFYSKKQVDIRRDAKAKLARGKYVRRPKS
jgi:hypothetical protein